MNQLEATPLSPANFLKSMDPSANSVEKRIGDTDDDLDLMMNIEDNINVQLADLNTEKPVNMV